MQLDALIQLALASFWMFKDAVYLGRLIFTFDFAKKIYFSKQKISNDENELSESNFTETQFVGILTPKEIQGRLPETITYRIYDLRVEPVFGALFKMDIEKSLESINITHSI